VGETENSYNILLRNLNQRDRLAKQRADWTTLNINMRLTQACVTVYNGFILFTL